MRREGGRRIRRGHLLLRLRLFLRSPLEMDSLIFPHLRSTFVATDITTVCQSGIGDSEEGWANWMSIGSMKMFIPCCFRPSLQGHLGEAEARRHPVRRKRARSWGPGPGRRFMSICDFRRIFPMSAMLWLWLWVLCYVMRGGDDGRGHTRVGARTESPTPSLIRLLYVFVKASLFPPKTKTSAALRLFEPEVLQ